MILRGESPRRERAAELGDRFMLQSQYSQLDQREIRELFGSGFAEILMEQPVGEWVGPLESGCGIHLVYLSERIEASAPPLAAVRDRVESDWHGVLPGNCVPLSEPRIEQTPGAVLERIRVECGEAGLLEGPISIENLAVTLVDVLVRVEMRDGSVVSRLLRPEAPSFEVSEGGGVPVLGYVRMGVQHILLGLDHLPFVLGLLLIVEGGWNLVKTITAFTVAHSITLALATRGVQGG